MRFFSRFYASKHPLNPSISYRYHVLNIDISWHNLKSHTYHTCLRFFDKDFVTKSINSAAVIYIVWTNYLPHNCRAQK
jgi:hypothetical protein